MTIPRRKPRIAFFDIETSPMIITAWTLYEANAVWVIQDTKLLSFSVKWAGQNSVKVHALPDYKGYKRNDPLNINDEKLARDLWRVMNDADIIVAHNGDAFDIKKANARFAVHGLQPPDDYKSVDTLKIARRKFKFDSNKLDNLGRYLGVGRKIPNTGAKLWQGCMDGDPKSWALMRRYNAQDVRLLEAVYLKLRPWGSHPDINLYTGLDNCPTCQSDRIKKRGLHYLKSTIRQRFKCQDCGTAWCGALVK